EIGRAARIGARPELDLLDPGRRTEVDLPPRLAAHVPRDRHGLVVERAVDVAVVRLVGGAADAPEAGRRRLRRRLAEGEVDREGTEAADLPAQRLADPDVVRDRVDGEPAA